MSALGQKQTHALQQFCRYSITRSARPSNGSGMAMPRCMVGRKLDKPITLDQKERFTAHHKSPAI
jgi:hypothetical protein